MRCAYGQVWNADNSACTGDAVRVDWSEGLKIATNVESTDLNQWRLPNVKELATIVEKQCVDPAINMTVFPNAPATDFWTSSTSANNPSQAWALAFYNGRNNQQGKNVDKYVRLVKFAN
jgi:type II secretory pathway pseudopilin PulG